MFLTFLEDNGHCLHIVFCVTEQQEVGYCVQLLGHLVEV